MGGGNDGGDSGGNDGGDNGGNDGGDNGGNDGGDNGGNDGGDNGGNDGGENGGGDNGGNDNPVTISDPTVEFEKIRAVPHHSSQDSSHTQYQVDKSLDYIEKNLAEI